MANRDIRRSSQPRNELERSAWPELDSSSLEILRSHGEERTFAAGDLLFDVGQPGYDFFLVESGRVEITDRVENRVIVQIEPGQFAGDIGMLMGQSTFLAGIAAEESRVLVVPQERLRELVRTIPEVGDIVLPAFAARRRLLVEWNEGGLVILGDDGDPAALRLREFVGRSQIPYRWVERSDSEAIASLSRSHELPAQGAAAIVGRSRILEAPSPRDLASAIGVDLVADTATTFDTVIIGGGPGGLAAAVYAASEGLSTLVVEDTAIGGQAGTSSRIENYLGFPGGVSGKELAFLAQIQAVKFGARITAPRGAVALEHSGDLFSVALDDGRTVRGRAIILANGVQYRRLPLDGLESFEGRGIYYAATDLEARFCRNTDAVIVGGGNSAGQAAMFLSRYANRTHILIRGEGLSETMSSYLSSRILSDERIRLWTRTEVAELIGDDRLQRIRVKNRESGETSELTSQALFIMVGAAPHTDWLDGKLALDERGFVLTGDAAREGAGRFEASCPGIFAVGDIRAGSVKRVASAVGEGSVVVSDVHRFLAAGGT